MGSLSIDVSEDSISIVDEGQAIGRLMKDRLNPIGLESFLKANYNLQGAVNYQSWLSGVLAGVVLIFGPPALPSEDPEEGDSSSIDGDGSGETAREYQAVAESEVGNVESVLGVTTAGGSPDGAAETIPATVETMAATAEATAPDVEPPSAPEAGVVSP